MNLINYGQNITHTLIKSVSEIAHHTKLFFEYFKDEEFYWESKRFPYYGIHFKANEPYIQSYWNTIIKLLQHKKISIILIKQDDKPIGFSIFSFDGSYAILYKSPLFIYRQNSRGMYDEAHFIVCEIIHMYYPSITNFILFITHSLEQKNEHDILSKEALYRDESTRFMQEGLKQTKWNLTHVTSLSPVKELITHSSNGWIDSLDNTLSYDIYTKSIREKRT